MRLPDCGLRRWLLGIAVAALLAGCANQPKTLYQWGSYEEQVYSYFKGKSSPQEQIEALEKDEQVGNDAKAQEYLAAEKEHYPESATYVDFLLKKKNKS